MMKICNSTEIHNPSLDEQLHIQVCISSSISRKQMYFLFVSIKFVGKVHFTLKLQILHL